MIPARRTIPAMELTTTLPIGAGTTQAIEALVRQFPDGKRVRIVVTEEPSLSPPNVLPAEDPTLADFLQRLDDARRLLPPSPWQTTEEALAALREGEHD
jgi:hypothetical protein